MRRTKYYGFFTMVLLVLLRLAIGWHFFFEGAHKLDTFAIGANTSTNKVFSSAGYFREAPGPLAAEMRKHLGDPDDDALALPHARCRRTPPSPTIRRLECRPL